MGAIWCASDRAIFSKAVRRRRNIAGINDVSGNGVVSDSRQIVKLSMYNVLFMLENNVFFYNTGIVIGIIVICKLVI